DRHRHFGVVAGRAVAGACEDHRIHVGGAQALVRGLAHRPTQRLDEIRLAATVGADHAGEARLDDEVRWLNERLEAVKAQAGDFHKHASLLAGANPPAGTIPWKAMSLSGRVARGASCGGQWPRCAARATSESRFSQGIYAGKDTAFEMRIRIL